MYEMAKSIKIMIFWNLMQRRFVEEYQGFDEACSVQLWAEACLPGHYPEKFCPPPILTT